MEYYIVTRDILNIRSKPVVNNDTYIGELYKGEVIRLQDEPVFGDQPPGATDNIWRKDHYNRVVHSNGVRVLTWPEKKKLMTDAIQQCWDGPAGAVAVLDTGIIDNHPNLPTGIVHLEAFNGQVDVYTPGPLPDLHGSVMAGIIAGKKSGDKVVGVSPESVLADYRIDMGTGTGVPGNMLTALTDIRKKASIRVINISQEITFVLPNVLQNVDEAFAELINDRRIIVAATGNQICDKQDLFFPGSNNRVITVGILRSGVPTEFVDCLAQPGVLQLTRQPDCFIELDEWETCTRTGTASCITAASSEATAIMSGLIALKVGKKNTLNQEIIRQQIFSSSILQGSSSALIIRKLDIPAFLNI